MSNDPIISVIMPVFNGGEHLNKAIESILGQTFENFEFIIINDGSTDETAELIKGYVSSDSRIIFIDQDNIGLTKSLNKAIKVSKGNYVARMDADDVSELNRFEVQLEWMKGGKYDLCCSRTYLLDSNRISPGLSYYIPKRIQMFFRNPFIHGTFLIKKEALDVVGLYDEKFVYSQDYKLVCEFYRNNLKIKYIKQHLYCTNTPPGSIGVSKLVEQNYFASCVKKLCRALIFRRY